MEAIKILDIFKKQILFNVKGEEYSTKTGGIVSFFIMISYLAVIAYFSVAIYNKNEPKVNEKINYARDKNYPHYIINQENSFISFNVYSEKGFDLNNPKFFEIRLKLLQFSNVGNREWNLFSKSNETTQPCPNKYNKEFDLEILNSTLCGEYNSTIGGSWNYGNISFYYYSLNRCNTKTEKSYNIKCATDVELYEYMQDHYFYLDMYVQSNLYHSDNYSSPIKKYLIYRNILLDYSKGLASEIYDIKVDYFKSTVSTDDGLIFSNINNETFIELDTINQQKRARSSYVDDMESLATIVVELTNKEKEYTRSYSTLPDILANTGGLFGLIMPFISYFTNIFIDAQFSEEMTFSLFSLKLDEEDPFLEKAILEIEQDKKKNVF